ncbi:cation:dicarboxylate symporter family transporter, partial [Escherichia coli]|uniref:cation:dicarboxylate symporter family transporter n=1 Tax=Escherichia coli TaxID=562 RepID=UPI0022845686
RMIKMIIAPLVFATLVSGLASMSDASAVGRIGLRAMFWFIAASAILTEAVLSFLGVGIPPQTPSWGNIMAEGRNFVAVAFHIILYPGLFLGVAVLAVNLVGDGLRDMLDPRLAKKL